MLFKDKEQPVLLYSGFEICSANIDWLFSVTLTTQFLFPCLYLPPTPTHFVSFIFTPSFSLSHLCRLCFPYSRFFNFLSTTAFFVSCLPVALYAISAVYFAGVMVRLMLTLTPVVCMLSAVAFSSVFEHYMGDDTKREKPPAEDSSDEDDKRNSGNLYDKVKARQRNCWIYTSLIFSIDNATLCWCHVTGQVAVGLNFWLEKM